MYPVLLLLACTPDVAREKEAPNGFTALPEWVNIQADSARMSQVIDNEWVAVGIRKDEALGLDHSRMYGGKPSYRFTLGRDDNTLEGYAPRPKAVRNLPGVMPRQPISQVFPTRPTPTPSG